MRGQGTSGAGGKAFGAGCVRLESHVSRRGLRGPAEARGVGMVANSEGRTPRKEQATSHLVFGGRQHITQGGHLSLQKDPVSQFGASDRPIDLETRAASPPRSVLRSGLGIARPGYHSCVIELKRSLSSANSPQRPWVYLRSTSRLHPPSGE